MPLALQEPSSAVETPGLEVVGPADAPVIVALGGISADRHVCAHHARPHAGWWEGVAGAHRALDTTRYRVAGFDFIDGGHRADGRPARIVTTHDQADALASALDTLGIERVHALVGASYGGMVALAFAERYPERVERLVVIGAAHRTHPLTTALRSIQRRIVELGLDTDRAHDALALARGLAMTTYRSAREFGERFDTEPSSQSENGATFPVEHYLRHHGEKFAARWTPARFLALSLSSDLHAVDPAAIRTPTVLVAAEGDQIVPRADIDALGAALGAPSVTCELASVNGHDAFLTETVRLGAILESALQLPSLHQS